MKKTNKSNVAAVAIAAPAADTTKAVEITAPAVPSVAVPAVKVKTPQITDGCMVGRMSKLRDCVKAKNTYEETLVIIREKYPFGLTGKNAIRWITKHYDRIAKKLAPAPVAVATPSPAPSPTAPAPAEKPSTRKSRKTAAVAA